MKNWFLYALLAIALGVTVAQSQPRGVTVYSRLFTPLENARVEYSSDAGGDLDFSLERLSQPESVLLGGDGGVNGGANLHPRLFVEWFEAAVANDAARIQSLGEQVRLLGQIYKQADEFMAVIRGLKCALSLAGLCDDRLAEPLQPCDAATRERIAVIVQQLGLLPVASQSVA